VVAGRTKRHITLEEEVAKRLLSLRNTHAITREWVRASALQGVITDGNGAVVYNLNTVFGIVPTVIDFVLGTPATDVIGKCQQVWQSISSNLGEVMRAVEAIVDPTFFGELIEHPNVAKYWLQAEQGTSIANMVRVQRLGQMWGRAFYFQNIFFREYYGTAPIKTGNPPAITSTPFWAPATGTAYPVGTMNMFRTFDGPANDLRFVGEVGAEIYVSPKILEGEALRFEIVAGKPVRGTLGARANHFLPRDLCSK
jgi:Phage major capsid protein E